MKDSTCSWIHSKKDSLDQRQTLMMMMTDVPEMNIAVAPPDQIECNPLSYFLKPKTFSTINTTIACSFYQT